MNWKTLNDEEPKDEEEVLIVSLDNKVHSVRCFYKETNDYYFSKEDGLYFESWNRDEIKYWSYFPEPPKD